MNSKMLLDALGDISDEYVMGAQKYLTNDVLKITKQQSSSENRTPKTPYPCGYHCGCDVFARDCYGCQ